MAVSLSKGGKISLAKAAADSGVAASSLVEVMVGLGWDTNRYDGGAQFDLDAAAFMLGANGKVRSDADFIFYNQKEGQGVTHMGDNRTGEGDGDDEQIFVDLDRVPADVGAIVFAVNIYDAFKRNQHFGMLRNAFIRVVDHRRNIELCRFNLNENYNNDTALIAGGLTRTGSGWEFTADGAHARVESLVNVVASFS